MVTETVKATHGARVILVVSGCIPDCVLETSILYPHHLSISNIQPSVWHLSFCFLALLFLSNKCLIKVSQELQEDWRTFLQSWQTQSLSGVADPNWLSTLTVKLLRQMQITQLVIFELDKISHCTLKWDLSEKRSCVNLPEASSGALKVAWALPTAHLPLFGPCLRGLECQHLVCMR